VRRHFDSPRDWSSRRHEARRFNLDHLDHLDPLDPAESQLDLDDHGSHDDRFEHDHNDLDVPSGHGAVDNVSTAELRHDTHAGVAGTAARRPANRWESAHPARDR
jgi:hypothetical protein